MPNDTSMERLVALAKTRGFVFPGSEIYDGLANTWDYGPLGAELKKNIRAAWWKRFVQQSATNVGLDCAILMNPRVWEASGHVGNFSDPLTDCRQCKARHRADTLVEVFNTSENIELSVEGWSHDELSAYIQEKHILCPQCGAHDFTKIREFNLMFKTHIGVTEDRKNAVYLRPETAQGIFVNFKNVQRTMRKKIPFGICQVGKAFRNEITPGNFIFRILEFEQMELEFFCEPGTDLTWFAHWKDACYRWLLDIGLKEDELRMRDHAEDELSFYSNATTDIEFKFLFGWGELWGIADRTDYDIKQHMEHAKEDLSYFDPVKNEKYIPYVIEPSVGLDRLVLAAMSSAYDEETLADGDVRTVMRFHPALAPIQIGVLPLSTKLAKPTRVIFDELSRDYCCEYDDRQSIGKRYRRQDEIGTPYCVVYDFDSEIDGCVEIRVRDTMEKICYAPGNVRFPIKELTAFFSDKFVF